MIRKVSDEELLELWLLEEYKNECAEREYEQECAREEAEREAYEWLKKQRRNLNE